MKVQILFFGFIAIAYASTSSRGANVVLHCGAYSEATWNLSELGESPNFTIISHHMGQDYYNDTTCTVQLKTDVLPTFVVVKFDKFDVELSDGCVNDWLCVRGMRLCGEWGWVHPFIYAVPANKTFTMKFHSDSAETRTGFQIRLYTTRRFAHFRSFAPYDINYATQEIDMSKFARMNETFYIDDCATGKFDVDSPNYFSKVN